MDGHDTNTLSAYRGERLAQGVEDVIGADDVGQAVAVQIGLQGRLHVDEHQPDAGASQVVKVHLSVNLGGRTRGCYLGREREALVTPLIAEYQRAWRVINELTAVNLALVRGTHPGGRATRTRQRRRA